jgi:CheY-like chemotaxis protein
LIVEDNAVNALILATFLKKRGFPFSKAENGLLAVQAVKARPEGFDVILMDIQSPPPNICGTRC